jgi:hypothetical protein
MANWNELNKKAGGKTPTKIVTKSKNSWSTLNEQAKLVKPTSTVLQTPVNEPTVQSKQTLSDWLGVKPNYLMQTGLEQQEFVKNPLQGLWSAGSAAVSSIGQSATNWFESNKKLITNGKAPVAERISDWAGAVQSDVGLVFSPVIAAFAAAEKIPGLQHSATALNVALNVIGKPFGWASDKIVDTIPTQLISQQDKDSFIKPSMNGLATTAGQILLGGKILEGIGAGKKIDAKTVKTFVEEVKKVEPKAQAILDKKVAETTKLSAPKEPALLSAPKEKYVVGEGFTMTEKPNKLKVETTKITNAYNKAVQDFTVKPTPKNLEIVQKAKVAKENLIVKTEKPVTPTPTETKPIRLTWDEANKQVKVAQPVLPTEPPKIPTPTELKPSGIAKSIEAKAVEKGLTDKGYDELAGYDASTKKIQGELGAKYSVEQHIKFATGKEARPAELKPATSLSIAEDFAMETKNGELARELANSPAATEISNAASATSLSKMRTPDSATAKIKEVIKARENVAVKKMLGKSTEKMKSKLKTKLKEKIEKNKVNKYSWDSFVESIKC